MENTEYMSSLASVADNMPDTEPDRQRAYMALLKKYFSDMSEKIGRPLTMCTVTFGCPIVLVTEISCKPLFIRG